MPDDDWDDLRKDLRDAYDKGFQEGLDNPGGHLIGLALLIVAIVGMLAVCSGPR